MDDKVVRRYGDVDLPVVEGWEWVEDDDGELVARTTEPHSSKDTLEVYMVHYSIDRDRAVSILSIRNDDTISVPAAIMKAMLEANRV